MPNPAPPTADIVAHYKRLLKMGETGAFLESAGFEGAVSEPDLSPGANQERIGSLQADLHRIVKDHLGDKQQLHEIADQIAKAGRDSLDALHREAPEDLGDIEGLSEVLEVIVRSDGSRPSFMVRNGEVDTTTSPIGGWAIALDDSAELLRQAVSCVGRIDVPGSAEGFEGTGFLIHQNLIVTNRHVLQAFGRPDAEGVWMLKSGAVIDFGHEFRGRESVTPRALRQVIFAPPKLIRSPVDHTRLDLVLIELEPASEAPEQALALDISPDWALPEQIIYTVGYPGNPGLGEPLSLIEQLFQSTFGCKRVAPGEIKTANASVHTWTLAHDASTLGGNSGSAVLVAGREGAAAGLHYGGRRLEPRENWGHVLGLVLSETDNASGKTLRECLDAFGVKLVDRLRVDG
jgi:hypothetical protein